MTDQFAEELASRALERVTDDDARAIALLGFTPATLHVRQTLESVGLGDRVVGIFESHRSGVSAVRSLDDLATLDHDLIVVGVDAEKEDVLLAYRDRVVAHRPPPSVVLAGVGHLAFRDRDYELLNAPALVPSYATGSPNTRAHLFQCLKAASRGGLRGAIVEFGAFKGGTTAWLARVAAHFGFDGCRVIGFDTWDGFPPRRTVLDLYKNPRCVFTDLAAVQSYVEPFGVELINGDIVDTHGALKEEQLLLCFFDTDNYSPTRAALELCARQLVVGGSIVFDHVATSREYIDTIGERIAAFEVLDAPGFLHLHGTGVFTKISSGLAD